VGPESGLVVVETEHSPVPAGNRTVNRTAIVQPVTKLLYRTSYPSNSTVEIAHFRTVMNFLEHYFILVFLFAKGIN
jgi:hypothetical protein